MTEILYSKKGEEKYLDIRWVFKVDLNPATKGHLAQVLESYLKPKGIPMETESHKIEILDTKAMLQEILACVQEDIDFGAEHQQIVSTKAQSKLLVMLHSM